MTPASVIRLLANDDVLIATAQLLPGSVIESEALTVDLIPPGHKVAAHAISKGEKVRRYNQIIGFATADIAAGAHIHAHNLGMGEFERDYGIGQDVHELPKVAKPAAARYAWAANPEGCNLYSKSGLPVAPFRTDNWPLLNQPQSAQPQ